MAEFERIFNHKLIANALIVYFIILFKALFCIFLTPTLFIWFYFFGIIINTEIREFKRAEMHHFFIYELEKDYEQF